MDQLMARLRRVLNYEVTVEAVIEIAMWLAIPYLVIGLVWGGFFHVEAVQQLEVQLNRVLPAGAEVGGRTAWPHCCGPFSYCCRRSAWPEVVTDSQSRPATLARRLAWLSAFADSRTPSVPLSMRRDP